MISLGGMSPEGMRGRRRVGSALGASLEEHQLTSLTQQPVYWVLVLVLVLLGAVS